MSDAGKVLVDANGDFILGVGGVVLADDTYPMVPTQQAQYYYRSTGNVFQPDYAARVIWTQTWAPYPSSIGVGLFSQSNYTLARQSVVQVKFDIAEGETDPIDWPRVKKLTQVIYTSNNNSSYDEVLRVSSAMNISSIPGNYGIRDDWTLVQDLGGGSFFAVKIEWVIDGVKPDNVAYAFAYTAEDDLPFTCTSGQFRFPVRVVYNLAT